MPCRRLALLVLAATLPALATAAPACAKGVAELKACGSDGCHAVQDARHLTDLVLGGGGRGGRPPDSGRPFYRVRVFTREPGARRSSFGFSFLYVPSRHLIRRPSVYSSFEWLRLDPAQDHGLRRAVRGLHPYPAARLPLDRPPLTSPPPSRAAAPAGDAARGGSGPSAWWIALLGAAALATLAAILAHRRHGPAA
jgi:hypothetical protein